MTVMPGRKRPTPPSTEITVDMRAPEVNAEQASSRNVAQLQSRGSQGSNVELLGLEVAA
jgi:hypothetical protein